MFRRLKLTFVLQVLASLAALAPSAYAVNYYTLTTAQKQYGILASSGVTLSGTTSTGNVGTSGTLSMTTSQVLQGAARFSGAVSCSGDCSNVRKGSFANAGSVTTALNDYATLATQVAALPATGTYSTLYGGTTLTSGVYDAMTVALGGFDTLVFDAQGDSSAQFIVRVSFSMLINNQTTIVLANGAQADNVLFYVTRAGSTNLGTLGELPAIFLFNYDGGVSFSAPYGTMTGRVVNLHGSASVRNFTQPGYTYTAPVAPFVRTWSKGPYYRGQSNAVALVSVQSEVPGTFTVGFTADSGFSATNLSASPGWTCNVGALSCSHADDGQSVFGLFQLAGTVSNNAPSSINLQTTLSGTGLSSPAVDTQTARIYAPARIYQWGATSQSQAAGVPSSTPGFTSVSPGFLHSNALTSDGHAVAWGNNTNNQAVAPSGSGFLQSCAGSYHNAFLSGDGHITMTGLNNVGQSNGVPPAGGHLALACGSNHTVALTADGHIVQWGYSNEGQTNDLPTDGGYVALAAGYNHSVALKADGSIVQWGSNSIGQRNNLPTASGFTAVECGSYFCLALRQDGSLVFWGSTANNADSGMPTGSGYVQLAAGAYTSAVLDGSGAITLWNPVLGHANPSATSGYSSVALGGSFGLALIPLAAPTATGTPQVASVSTAFASQLQVTVLDAQGRALVNVPVTFTAPGSGASATFTGGSNTITVNTDTNGVAAATATANASAGTYSVTATVLSGLASVSFSLTNAGPPVVTSVLESGGAPMPEGKVYGSGAAGFRVSYQNDVRGGDDAGNFLFLSRADGQSPLTTSCGSVAAGDTPISIASAVYNNSGPYYSTIWSTSFPANMRFKLLVCATNMVNAANSLRDIGAGALRLSADYAGPVIATTPILAVNSVTQGSPGGSTISEAQSLSAISAIAVNLNAAFPAAQVHSVFKLLTAPLAGSGCSSTGTAVAGTASVSGNSIVFTASSPLTPGAQYRAVVCGTMVGNNGIALAAVQNADGVPGAGSDFVRNFTILGAASITVSGGANQSASVNTAFANPLEVTVRDSNSNPVAGVNVTFTAPASGASGKFSNNTATITVPTNASGIASATITANGTGGAYNVTVSAGAAPTVDLGLTNVAATSITVPAGVTFSINGTPYTGPQNLTLAPGNYTLSTSSPQSLGSGVQAVFANWSDTGAISHSITVAGSPLSITGNFTTQYQLTTAAGTGGSVSPGSGYYDANTVVGISATAGSGYQFSSWTGPVAAPGSASTSVTMNGAKSVTANFIPVTTLTAGAASATYSPASQNVTLTATVQAAVAVNGGTVTFTVPGVGVVVSGAVVNGAASAQLAIPGGTGAGPYTIQAAYSNPGAFTSSIDNSKQLTIGKATPVLTWPAPAAITFGSALSGTQLKATANVPGTFVYTPPVGTVLPPGAGQTLSVLFTPTATANYNTATTSVVINVNPGNGQLVGTYLASRDAGTGEIVLRYTLANTGSAAINNLVIKVARIGAVNATTPVLPVSVGSIAGLGQQTIVFRFPPSAGAAGAASTLTIQGTHSAGALNTSARITLP